MSRRVLVTGCTGLVGHGICLGLLNEGYDVIGTSRHALRDCHPRFRSVQLDLGSPGSIDAFDAAFDGVHVLVHNAAKLPSPADHPDASWDEYVKINVTATRQLLVAAARRRLDRAIYISASPSGILKETAEPLSEETPIQPKSNYAASKIAAEAVCLQFDAERRLPVAVLRFPAPYGFVGTAEGVIPRFIGSARAGQPLTLWGTGLRQQTFTFVIDIGYACVKAIERHASGIFHVAGPEAVSMTQLAEAVLQAFPGSASRIEFNGLPDPQEHRRVTVSFEKARRELGYEPRYSLVRGLSEIAAPKASTVIFESGS